MTRKGADEERDCGDASDDAADEFAADDDVDAEDATRGARGTGGELDDATSRGETGEQRWERPHTSVVASRRAHVEAAEDLNDGGATDAPWPRPHHE